MSEPKCPKCASEYTYADGSLWICPQCAHEWSDLPIEPVGPVIDRSIPKVLDAHGSVLNDGDSVTVLKDLKVKGSSSALKAGTKIKGIRLVDGYDGHNISCKIAGVGSVNLKSEFVKKA
jgi:protein PhnA